MLLADRDHRTPSPTPHQQWIASMKDHATSVSTQASRNLTESGKAIQKAAQLVTAQAVGTARIVISAEEKLRQRVRSALRVAVATIFFGISGLISLGANVTTAFAKKVSTARTHHGAVKVKRASKHQSGKLHHHHSGKLRHRHHGADRSMNLRPTHSMHGVASWYGRQFNHRRTASGVRFNTHAMMAAHRTLPFGTKVRVTNLENDKSCIVEITDRGPFSHGRIIDLSYAAAERIGMTERGTAQVQLEVLSPALEPTSYEDIAARRTPAVDKLVTQSRTLASILNAPVTVEDDDQ